MILNHLDSPLRFLLWTPGEIVMYLGPIFLGVALDQLLLGTIITTLNIWANRQYKRRFGKGQLHAVLYWFLPHQKRRLPGIPPSYVRAYLG